MYMSGSMGVQTSAALFDLNIPINLMEETLFPDKKKRRIRGIQMTIEQYFLVIIC